MNNLFPAFLKLENMKLLLVGGGNVGLEKLEALLKNSPKTDITIVATYFREEVLELGKEYDTIQIIHRAFEMNDLDGKNVAILATDNRKLHEEIKEETKKRNILTNVADTPDLCDFYLSSVVCKGDLKIAISTNGKSPTLAKRTRQYLEQSLPDDVQELLDNLQVFRNRIKGDFAQKVKELNELTKGILEK